MQVLVSFCLYSCSIYGIQRVMFSYSYIYRIMVLVCAVRYYTAAVLFSYIQYRDYSTQEEQSSFYLYRRIQFPSGFPSIQQNLLQILDNTESSFYPEIQNSSVPLIYKRVSVFPLYIVYRIERISFFLFSLMQYSSLYPIIYIGESFSLYAEYQSSVCWCYFSSVVLIAFNFPHSSILWNLFARANAFSSLKKAATSSSFTDLPARST